MALERSFSGLGRWVLGRGGLGRQLLALALVGPLSALADDGSAGGAHRIRVTPDLDDTEEGLMLTNEANIYRTALDINLFVEYQHAQWDVGIYMLNMPAVPTTSNYDWDSYISLSRWFIFTDDFKIGLGTQNGTTVFTSGHKFHNFEFAKASYDLNEWFTFSSGAYYLNRALGGSAQTTGFMVGLDVNFIPDRLWLEGDFQSGINYVSGTVVNLFWKPQRAFSFYAGVQIPPATTSSNFIGTLGVSLSPDFLQVEDPD